MILPRLVLHQDDTVLHPRDPFRIDKLLVFGRQMDMNGNHIGARRELIELEVLEVRDTVPGPAITTDDAHAQAAPIADHHRPETADPKHAEGLARKLAAAVAVARPTPGHGRLVGSGDLARRGQHQCEGQLGRSRHLVQQLEFGLDAAHLNAELGHRIEIQMI